MQTRRILTRRNRGFTLLELMLVVAILGLLASAAIPSYVRYMRRVKTSEATMAIRQIFDGAVVYFAGDPADSAGDLIQHQFPASTAPFPSLAAIGPDKITTSGWQDNDTWDALHFAVADPHYYAYQFNSNGINSAAQFTASAFGNLDGDDSYSTFVRFGTVTGMMVSGSQGVFISQELE